MVQPRRDESSNVGACRDVGPASAAGRSRGRRLGGAAVGLLLGVFIVGLVAGTGSAGLARVAAGVTTTTTTAETTAADTTTDTSTTETTTTETTPVTTTTIELTTTEATTSSKAASATAAPRSSEPPPRPRRRSRAPSGAGSRSGSSPRPWSCSGSSGSCDALATPDRPRPSRSRRSPAGAVLGPSLPVPGSKSDGPSVWTAERVPPRVASATPCTMTSRGNRFVETQAFRGPTRVGGLPDEHFGARRCGLFLRAKRVRSRDRGRFGRRPLGNAILGAKSGLHAPRNLATGGGHLVPAALLTRAARGVRGCGCGRPPS